MDSGPNPFWQRPESHCQHVEDDLDPAFMPTFDLSELAGLRSATKEF
jgi:hypothetical protein